MTHIWLVLWCIFQHGFVETNEGIHLAESQESWDVGCRQLYHLQTLVNHLFTFITLYRYSCLPCCNISHSAV